MQQLEQTQPQRAYFSYDRANPEEIILKLQAMIKILGEHNGNE